MHLRRKHHRKTIMQQAFPESWEDIIRADVPYDRLLEPGERVRLREVVAILIDEKFWEGCNGLEMTERIQVVIAAQAAVLLLHLDSADYLQNVRTFLVYPAAYVQSQERVGADGLVHSGSANLGEAWYNGPVVLSWKDTIASSHRPGRGLNVVFHELAHTIDMMTGSTNGTPTLRHRDHYATWHRVMSESFTTLKSRYGSGQRDVIRPYALTNVAEFFAVVTENFFDAPRPLRAAHPEIYEQFSQFWGQDPAARQWS